jgi:L-seryl-tRNA(Ser) seleniumtransferase
MADRFSSLPSVDRLLRDPRAAPLLARYQRGAVTAALRAILAEARAALRRGPAARSVEDADIFAAATRWLERLAAPRLRAVVNASGVVIHTNLGRAVLAAEAVAAVAAAAASATAIELDLASGTRGARDSHVEEHLRALTDAEAATVVNNNAAAVLLALNTLAEGRDVVISRGELIEIGGSFRIPEILAKSGARLREVGTTNRTHLRDYERAVDPTTGLILKVHTSNYRVVGFTAAVGMNDLIALGRAHGVPVMEDLGSGALLDLATYGLPREPIVADSIRAGADLVTFSGDKLLGGPQAGVLVGRREIIDRLRRNPLARALRCDKLTIAALEATLSLYRRAPDLTQALPTLRALTRAVADIDATAGAAKPLLEACLGPGYDVEIVEAASEIGSGALPAETLPSKALAITNSDVSVIDIAARFRAANPPIIGRVHDDRFLLDLRCIERPEDVVPRDGKERELNAEAQRH